MPIEEITLSVPESLPEAGSGRSVAAETGAINTDDRVVGRYRRILADRYRFAWTHRGRRRRQTAFEVAYRGLVKQLAKEVTEPIADRTVKLDIRTRIYAALTGILAVATEDQRQRHNRSRRLFTWGLALSGVGLVSLGAAAYLVL